MLPAFQQTKIYLMMGSGDGKGTWQLPAPERNPPPNRAFILQIDCNQVHVFFRYRKREKNYQEVRGLYFFVIGSILGIYFWEKMGPFRVHYFCVWVLENNCHQFIGLI